MPDFSSKAMPPLLTALKSYSLYEYITRQLVKCQENYKEYSKWDKSFFHSR